jgi:GH15 family glucan-1,4-alpha-glucosidase
VSKRAGRTPAIADYGLIGDCHSAALISGSGSIDWCCLPRFDSGSSFGKLLDQKRGGHCSVSVLGAKQVSTRSSYVDHTMVLCTTLEGDGFSLRVHDFFAMRPQGADNPRRELIRIVECDSGSAAVEFEVAPRFDYGAVTPWIRRMNEESFSAIGGNDGIWIWSDGELESTGDAVRTRASLHEGQRLRLVLRYVQPQLLDETRALRLTADEVDRRLEECVGWWQDWCGRVSSVAETDATVRSALTLKALTYAPTGAIVAAVTTSLPEVEGGERNWDYRYSWVRDSTMSAHALALLGCDYEAERFRQFIMRSAGGHAVDLQIMFGVGGERRMAEQQLDLDGYRGSRPVRVGNDAAGQLQLDAFGEILDLTWRWHRRGHSPDDDEWRFLADLVDEAARRWPEPDRGIWEWRDEPRHFVHSKACCWAAIDRGLALAQECERKAPVRRWRQVRQEIAEAVLEHGYDSDQGAFTQCFDEPELDAAVLLLPVLGLVKFDDARMVSTVDAVQRGLGDGAFLRRYKREDGLAGREGAFLPCSFWLAECYARQGRLAQARETFEQALSAASPLGLLAEQVDPKSGELLGNYPQALTHLAHVSAAAAIAEAHSIAPTTLQTAYES